MPKDMLTIIPGMTKPDELRSLMQNAERAKRDDVYWAAFKQLCVIEGRNLTDELEKDFAEVLAAYENLLTIKNGKRTQASRTRQKLKRKALVECLEDWANSATPTPGYKLLVANGLANLTAEYVVLKHADRFGAATLENACRRLQEAGVPLP